MKSSGALTSASAAAVTMSGLHINESAVDGTPFWYTYLVNARVPLNTTGEYGSCSIHGLLGKRDATLKQTHPDPRGWINTHYAGRWQLRGTGNAVQYSGPVTGLDQCSFKSW